jgi:sarcosine oxidase subunit alpha
MSALLFERREVPVLEGDTVASSLYRAGVRTFTRSSSTTAVARSTAAPASARTASSRSTESRAFALCHARARRDAVERAHGWPSTERDLLHVTDSLHRLMPVGFYYKTFIRPRFAWPLAERVIAARPASGACPRRRTRGRRRRDICGPRCWSSAPGRPA